MNYTDEQLVKDFLTGDEKSLELLVNKYLKPLYNFTYQLTRNKEASEDIVQDVFVKVWKNMSKFDTKKKFSTWIFAIAKNTAYDFLKKKKTIPFSAFAGEDGNNILECIEDETILRSQELMQNMDNVKDVQKFVASLPAKVQIILSLYHDQGFSLKEIAEILSSSPNTIKSKYRRAILWLRKKYSAKKA